MIIYLSDNNKTEIASWLQQGSVTLWQKPQDSGNMEKWNELGINPLEKVNAIILEITEPTPQLNYILAQAIILQKNTLCLYKKSQPPRSILMYLHKKNVPSCIQTKAYSAHNLKTIVQKFMHCLQPDLKLQEIPYIKYTLRLTDSLERYLDFNSKQTKKNKADIIREIIDKQAREDEYYQTWLKKFLDNNI